MKITQFGVVAALAATVTLGSSIPLEARSFDRHGRHWDRRPARVVHMLRPAYRPVVIERVVYRPVVHRPVVYHTAPSNGFSLQINDGGTRLGIALGFYK